MSNTSCAVVACASSLAYWQVVAQNGCIHKCVWCYLYEETLNRCLLVCLESQLIWKRELRIFANYFQLSLFIWGIVVWPSLVCFVFHWYVESLNHAFNTCFEIVCVVPFVTLQFIGRNKEVQPLQDLLSVRLTPLFFHQVLKWSIFYQDNGHGAYFKRIVGWFYW